MPGRSSGSAEVGREAKRIISRIGLGASTVGMTNLGDLADERERWAFEALPDAPQKHLLRSGQRGVRQYTQPAEAIIEREFAGTEGHDLKESTQNGDIL
jgi:hypothetical protein